MNDIVSIAFVAICLFLLGLLVKELNDTQRQLNQCVIILESKPAPAKPWLHRCNHPSTEHLCGKEIKL